MASALTTAAIGVAALTELLIRLIGWPGLMAVLTTLLVAMSASFLSRWSQHEWRGLLPLSLLGFVGWASISILWSEYQWATLGGLAYLGAFTLIALHIALTRDTIQIVRSTGDVLRAVLGASLVLEVFAGVLIDMPIPFLAIDGRIAELGPITGLAVTRNELGLLAIVGGITFATEWRTRSVSPLTSALSAPLALLTIALTQSSIVYLAAALALVAACVLYFVRRVRPERRQAWQFSLLAIAGVSATIAWLARSWLIDRLNGGGELDYRLAVWRQIIGLMNRSSVEGWGWIGRWMPDLPPFLAIRTPASRLPLSASNAFVDVWFQLGFVGLAIFIGMLGLAFVRSWLLAGRRRSVVYAWPAVVLVSLLALAPVESTILIDFGWLVFVICCVKASQELSWRNALRPPPSAALD